MDSTSAALQTNRSARLSPLEHLLLKHFIENAVDPPRAAQYLASKVTHISQNDVETRLRLFKQNWRQLVTRPVAVESVHIIPPSFLLDLESAEEGSLAEFLEAFLTPDYVQRLRGLLSVDDHAALQNLSLLSPSIHKAFRAGHGHVDVRSSSYALGRLSYPEDEESKKEAKYVLRKLYPEEPSGLYFGDGTEFEGGIRSFRISTSDPDGLPLPSPFLFGIHYRFATALHLFSIDYKAARGWPKPGSSIPSGFFYHFGARTHVYFLLAKIGKRHYGPAPAPWIQRLPFGLVMKTCVCSPQNEPNALRLVEQYTSVPAPRVVDVGAYQDQTYLVMTRIRGQPLLDVIHLMSYAERDRFANEARDCVAQLRQIPNSTPYLYCDILGGPIVDHRIPDGRGGPFNTEADFYKHLTSHLECSPTAVVGDLKLRMDHRSVFTYADFHPLNLLVERRRLSGIVDWECAGFKPEYWEFTKAMYSNRGGELAELFRQVFGDEYALELKVEDKFWGVTPFGV